MHRVHCSAPLWPLGMSSITQGPRGCGQVCLQLIQLVQGWSDIHCSASTHKHTPLPGVIRNFLDSTQKHNKQIHNSQKKSHRSFKTAKRHSRNINTTIFTFMVAQKQPFSQGGLSSGLVSLAVRSSRDNMFKVYDSRFTREVIPCEHPPQTNYYLTELLYN